MYSVLIVDDEDVIREGLKGVVDWEGLGFVTEESAANGEQALSILEKKEIDVVLTDVRMPRLSGIDLSEIIHKRFPEKRVVILSGYDNFNFAQRAIQFGVYHYILKPCREEEIVDVFSRLKTELDEDRRRRSSEKHAREVLLRHEAGEVLQRQRPPSSAQTLMGWIERFTGASAAIFHLWISISDGSLARILENDNAAAAVGEIPDYGIEREMNASNVLLVQTGHGQYGGILLAPHEEIASGMERLFHAVRKHIVQSGRHDLSGAYTIVEPTPGWLGQDHYGHLEASMELVNRRNAGTLFHADSSSPELDNQNNLPDPEEMVRWICDQKRGMEGREWETVLDMWRKRLSSMPGLNIRLLRDWFGSVSAAILRTLTSCGIDFTSRLRESDEIFKLLEPGINVERSIIIIKSLMEKASKELRRKQEQCVSRSIQEALDIINLRFSESISLEELAQTLGLSASYLSKLFKKETGKNFKEYLLGVRMERARAMLKQSGEKVYIVADSVGYPDQHYFSELFKRTTGFTPLEYRRLAPDD